MNIGKVLFTLILALIVLGFLASTSINLTTELVTVQSENEQWESKANQQQAEIDTLTAELNAVQAENSDLRNAILSLQSSLEIESAARNEAEAANTVLQN